VHVQHYTTLHTHTHTHTHTQSTESDKTKLGGDVMCPISPCASVNQPGHTLSTADSPEARTHCGCADSSGQRLGIATLHAGGETQVCLEGLFPQGVQKREKRHEMQIRKYSSIGARSRNSLLRASFASLSLWNTLFSLLPCHT
jgi:hypothetical protein